MMQQDGADDYVIATGQAGAGDLFYVFYAGPNRLRFGHDAWNFPGFETPDFFYDPEVEHTVEGGKANVPAELVVE